MLSEKSYAIINQILLIFVSSHLYMHSLQRLIRSLVDDDLHNKSLSVDNKIKCRLNEKLNHRQLHEAIERNGDSIIIFSSFHKLYLIRYKSKINDNIYQ